MHTQVDIAYGGQTGDRRGWQRISATAAEIHASLVSPRFGGR
jgi:hypothetical protein